MPVNIIRQDFEEAKEVLDCFMSDLQNIESIRNAGDLMVSAINRGNKIFSCGNGGSLCDAMHFSEELSGRFRNDRISLPAIALSDTAHITCVANDFGLEYIFSRYIDAIANSGDVLLAISTSGNSANILNAAESARKKGVGVVGLTGRDGGRLGRLCNVEVRVSHQGYSDRIQEVHIKIIHSLVRYIELHLF
ncbi:MAG: SIS domain-containing protein [Chitinophagaceae bacterium]|nr:SIS domain-containing protein [Chitinophagaceae bacterium]